MSAFCWKLSAIFGKTKGWDHLCTSVPGGLGLCSHRSHQLLGHSDILHLVSQVDSGVRIIIRYLWFLRKSGTRILLNCCIRDPSKQGRYWEFIRPPEFRWPVLESLCEFWWPVLKSISEFWGPVFKSIC